MKPRVCEREVLAGLLKNLALPFEFVQLRTDGPVVSLFLSPAEWDEVKKLVSKVGLDEIAVAWRELPPSIWTDESWVSRVCMRVCKFAPDYESLIVGKKRAAY